MYITAACLRKCSDTLTIITINIIILTVGYRGVEVHYNLQMTILIVTDSIPLVVRDGDDEFT